MNRIFVSYRRQDSIAIAGRIFDRLAGQFGSDEVFIDIDAIPPGVDFRAHISDALELAKVVLALIGETWLSALGPKGRRLDDPGDFVRIELEMAFLRGIQIIPVLLGSANMPKAEELPESIAGLAYLNATRIDVGRDFHSHINRLIRDLDQRLRWGGKEHQAPQLPGDDVLSLLTRQFQECDAMITVSPEHTLVTQPRTELIGFRDLINLFWIIEKNDNKIRPIIWILDLGRQTFEDIDARMRFLNVQALISRFKALKRFRNNENNDRWNWLKSRVVIIILDIWHDEQEYFFTNRPHFAANNVSLSAIDSSWINSENFRLLYGKELERLHQRAFTIFLNELPECRGVDLRYFGYALLGSDNAKADHQGRGLELPILPEDYADAFRTVCAAAAYALTDSDNATPKLGSLWPKQLGITGDKAIEQLRYLGYRVLRLENFLEGY